MKPVHVYCTQAFTFSEAVTWKPVPSFLQNRCIFTPVNRLQLSPVQTKRWRHSAYCIRRYLKLDLMVLLDKHTAIIIFIVCVDLNTFLTSLQR